MIEKIDFEKENGLVPVIIQDFFSNQVLMLGYMNKEAYSETEKTNQVTFYSRSKKRLWKKGESSGNFLNVKSIELDCDNDTLLIKAIPEGPTCHLNNDTCFRKEGIKNNNLSFLTDTIKDRKENPKEGSYTNKLLENINLAAQKVGEESVEMIIEAKDDNKDLFLNESADLLYHYLVLLETKNFSLDEVVNVLKARFGNND